MAVNTLTLTPIRLDNSHTLDIPGDTDLADSASLALFVQKLGDAVWYSQRIADMWNDNISSPATGNIVYANGSIETSDFNATGGFYGSRLLRYYKVTVDITRIAKDYDVISTSGGLAADKTLVLDTTGIRDGHELLVSNAPNDSSATSVNALIITAPIEGVGSSITLDIGASSFISVRLMWVGGGGGSFRIIESTKW